MVLQILEPGSEDYSGQLKAAIEQAIPGAVANVHAASPRHYEVSVTAKDFEGLSKVKQHQKVYAAIGSFIHGDDAPVHAIDRLDTRLP